MHSFEDVRCNFLRKHSQGDGQAKPVQDVKDVFVDSLVLSLCTALGQVPHAMVRRL